MVAFISDLWHAGLYVTVCVDPQSTILVHVHHLKDIIITCCDDSNTLQPKLSYPKLLIQTFLTNL